MTARKQTVRRNPAFTMCFGSLLVEVVDVI